eukprot:TRINITY_DN6157_c0_g1_i3.p1 TRINITY_DN6157_c0_g1~~TRINITY_DN6157_c0_g1_i3.p1  ORF type:complete len:265 (+),score=81.78 TRINITY_DN6157_c0_g1_i3:137-931(+)
MSSIIDVIQPFAIGGLSGMLATAVIQPIDTVKVRIQLINESKHLSATPESTNPFDVARSIRAKEGIPAFYKGLDSALLRQATYATARLGIYKTIVDDIKKKHQKTEISLWEKSYASIIAGFLGSLIGNPMDLILVRFQSDGLLPPEQRRNYKNAIDALIRITREEGLLTLWRGSSPTVLRAIAVNLGTLMPYDEVKDRLNQITGNKTETTGKRLAASAVSGVVGSVMCLPFDNIKTKLQRMKAGPDGKMPYKNLLDCFLKVRDF